LLTRFRKRSRLRHREFILNCRPMGSIIVLQLHRRGVIGQPSCLLQPIKLGLDACERVRRSSSLPEVPEYLNDITRRPQGRVSAHGGDDNRRRNASYFGRAMTRGRFKRNWLCGTDLWRIAEIRTVTSLRSMRAEIIASIANMTLKDGRHQATDGCRSSNQKVFPARWKSG
jgi:hypothetical protein